MGGYSSSVYNTGITDSRPIMESPYYYSLDSIMIPAFFDSRNCWLIKDHMLDHHTYSLAFFSVVSGKKCEMKVFQQFRHKFSAILTHLLAQFSVIFAQFSVIFDAIKSYFADDVLAKTESRSSTPAPLFSPDSHPHLRQPEG